VELWHDAFYRFVRIENLPELKAELLELCQSAGVLGTVLLASEGLNGMLAGSELQLGQVRQFLEADPRFVGMMYKRTVCQTKPFSRLKVKIKREIVPLGLEGVDATSKTGINLSPAEWRELIRRDDVVLIDNRNSFEFEHGHFKGAIDPEVGKFRSFSQYVGEHQAQWEGKKVAMYCTGGIRCEKTTAWLADQGLEVYQLEGGILNYFAQIPDAEADYQGDCFVFDDRVLLDTRLEEKKRK
jgi:UPF0176 protein